MGKVVTNDSKKPTFVRRLFLYVVFKEWVGRVLRCVGRIVRAGDW